MVKIGDIINDYRVERAIGLFTFYAIHIHLGHKVLLIGIPKDWCVANEISLMHKISKLLRIKHPSIPTLYGFFYENPCYYVVTEYVMGTSVTELIEQNGLIPEARCQRILVQVAAAMSHLHFHEIWHGFISSENIIVDPNNNDQVTIVGFFDQFNQFWDNGPDGPADNYGSMLHLVYCSPQIVRGVPHSRASDDIYALGIVLYHMLTGELPFNFQNVSEYQLAYNIVNCSINDPREKYPYISDHMAYLVKSLTTQNPSERLQELGSWQTMWKPSPQFRKTNLQTVFVFPDSKNKNDDKMILCEGGVFLMGNDKVGLDCQPQHRVFVSTFYISRHLVTQREWLEVMGNGIPLELDENYPITKVSWFDAILFCNALSRKEFLQECYIVEPSEASILEKGIRVNVNWSASGYRLPTEAEWEYAARGGKLSRGHEFSGSNSLRDVGWYEFGGDVPGPDEERRSIKIHEVGQKLPNELGIFDMSGNVYEWCWDWYTRYQDTKGFILDNPRGPKSGQNRVVRGGYLLYDCDGPGNFCQVYGRLSGFRDPASNWDDVGFRVCSSQLTEPAS